MGDTIPRVTGQYRKSNLRKSGCFFTALVSSSKGNGAEGINPLQYTPMVSANQVTGNWSRAGLTSLASPNKRVVSLYHHLSRPIHYPGLLLKRRHPNEGSPRCYTTAISEQAPELSLREGSPSIQECCMNISVGEKEQEMKAVQIEEFGGPEVMQYRDVSDPTPGDGDALVEIQAVGVNFTDIYSRAGINPGPPLPRIIGVEGAGVVRSVGSGVNDLKEGDVVAYSSNQGSYAEQAVVPAARLVKMPEGLGAREGAAVMLQGMTAHYLCHSTYPVQPGDKVLVHAGAGGVGLLLIQMIKRLGGYVFSTVSTEDKAELARGAGADHVILYTQEDFADVIKEATGGEGLQAVYDAVGLTTFDKSVSCLARRGFMVLYGQASGVVPPMDPRILGNGSLFLTRPGLGDYTATTDELRQRAGDVLSWVLSGDLKLRVEHVFPLAEAAEAHRQLASRATTGKLLLIP